MAALALFVSLGGTSYAVATLPRNSVGSAQVKNGSLTTNDLAKGTLTSGPQGATGPRGPRGAEGAPGSWQSNVLVAALPASPADGEEVYFQTSGMAASGVVWHLRYRAAAAGPYKWEFVGGPGLYAVSGFAGTNATTYLEGDVGPSLTAPLAGEYEADISARMYHSGNAPGQATYVGLGDGRGEFANARLDQFQGTAGSTITLVAATNARVVRFTRGTPGPVDLRLFSSGGGSVTADSRDLRIRPVRVG